MREILFRGKRTDDGEWMCGNLTVWSDGGASIDKEPTEASPLYAVIPETVGQFTGLYDKYGKKIFEGDIIKQTFEMGTLNGVVERDIKSVIEYGTEYSYSMVCGVCQRFSDGSGRAILSIGDKRGTVFCEVIGNIHDNPELLIGGGADA